MVKLKVRIFSSSRAPHAYPKLASPYYLAFMLSLSLVSTISIGFDPWKKQDPPFFEPNSPLALFLPQQRFVESRFQLLGHLSRSIIKRTTLEVCFILITIALLSVPLNLSYAK